LGAEREGFEPSIGALYPYAGLANGRQDQPKVSDHEELCEPPVMSGALAGAQEAASAPNPAASSHQTEADADLQKVVTSWHLLPGEVRAVIIALVHSATDRK
jgi:hypothetical protein